MPDAFDPALAADLRGALGAVLAGGLRSERSIARPQWSATQQN
jgi:hypothetical protein